MNNHALRIALICFATFGIKAATFYNFETAPVHPLALSPDGRTLAACNLPDGQVELFDLTEGFAQAAVSIPVGVDPVSLRFRGPHELWVANHISSSLNIVDLTQRRVVKVIPTFAGPADILFTSDLTRAFISCARSNIVMVLDANTYHAITNVAILGDAPKALAMSADGSAVYVAIFESGNASTILGPKLTELAIPPGPSVVDDVYGPYGGQNPPPNAGSSFSPPWFSWPSDSSINNPPAVSHLIKKRPDGRWLDDHLGDWTEYVRGTNAGLSGRVVGWDMPDRDLAIIDTETFAVSYVRGLMNICMDVAVHPSSGNITVVGTDALNERRFTPNLQSVFLRVQMALIDPSSHVSQVKDLNPHLDYSLRTIPPTQRAWSLGDPRGVLWTSDGQRGFVTGMGSDNLIVLDSQGNRVATQPLALPEGPTGMCLDEARQHLYILNRFSASISTVNLATMQVKDQTLFFDPTPDFVKSGRRLLYNTHAHSGLGHVSCASCHVDGRLDRLAWDLGDPSAGIITNRFGIFHPMKGPKMTQTLQALNPAGPLHWRADQESIQEFGQTFVDLLGADAAPSAKEMETFGTFLHNIYFPPNPLRNFDNTLSTNLPLPGFYALDTKSHVPTSSALPNGNAIRGSDRFHSTCSTCHNPGSGLGADGDSEPNRILGRNTNLVFKVSQLRSLADKVGFDKGRPESRAGFGYFHDGRIDTIPRFLADGFDIVDPQETADLTAFLLSFSGSDIQFVGFEGGENVESDLEGSAAFGYQILLTNGTVTPRVQQMMRLAERPATRFSDDRPKLNRLELIAQTDNGTGLRKWQYLDGFFQSGRESELITATELLQLASPTNPVLLMMVGQGSAARIATDRDGDRTRDITESEAGFDPNDAQSRPHLAPFNILVGINKLWWQTPRIEAGIPHHQYFTILGLPNTPNIEQQAFWIQGTANEHEDPLELSGPVHFSLHPSAPQGAIIDAETGTFTWTPPPSFAGSTVRIPIRVRYAETNPAAMTETVVLRLFVNGEVRLEAPRINRAFRQTVLRAHVPEDLTYRLQYTDEIGSAPPDWIDLGSIYGGFIDDTWPLPGRRIYRIAFD